MSTGEQLVESQLSINELIINSEVIGLHNRVRANNGAVHCGIQYVLQTAGPHQYTLTAHDSGVTSLMTSLDSLS